MKRKNGYYWVKKSGEKWVIGFFWTPYSGGRFWHLLGDDGIYRDKDFQEIDETPIIRDKSKP